MGDDARIALARPDPVPEPILPACVIQLHTHEFKTFAAAVAIDILPHLVEPNSYGKSNVTDALRWVMGGSTARTRRGAEMEDVIFAGAATRPSLHQG